jgi:RND family efflux transporter MFP subunit
MSKVSPKRPETAWTRPILAAFFVAGLVLVLLLMAGTFRGRKISPAAAPNGSAFAALPPGASARVERREIEDFLEWPGSVRSRTVAAVAPKLFARILDVKVRAGDAIKENDPIAVLDDREVRARAEQARSALAAAESLALQAQADLARARALFEKNAATKAELEQQASRAKAAQAEAERARQALFEAETLLAETVVRAPFAGIVLDRLAEPGDMAVPGKPLATIHDPRRLRLEALVSEKCAAKASPGMNVLVRADGVAEDLEATIEEIAPAADPKTRTFLLKAALPENPALRAGVFGRFREPCGKREALLIPEAAVLRAGQIESVRVLEGGTIRTRNIRTGKKFGESVEVLAGLDEGEIVLLRGEP